MLMRKRAFHETACGWISCHGIALFMVSFLHNFRGEVMVKLLNVIKDDLKLEKGSKVIEFCYKLQANQELYHSYFRHMLAGRVCKK